MRKVDRLSRRLDWKVGVENDNSNQVFIISASCPFITTLVKLQI